MRRLSATFFRIAIQKRSASVNQKSVSGYIFAEFFLRFADAEDKHVIFNLTFVPDEIIYDNKKGTSWILAAALL